MIRLTFLGTGAAVPSVERNVSALLVEREGVPMLFDCGEGTQRQMMRYATGFGVTDIFFTHYHADHTLGLPGLLRTMAFQDRSAALRLHGPADVRRNLAGLIELGMERPKFPVELSEIAAGDQVQRGDFAIVAAQANHRGRCLGYALVESERLGRFDPDRARAMGIPEGPLWGAIHRGETITLADGSRIGPDQLVGRPRPGRRIAMSGDTTPCDAIRELARGADVLVHEATFGEDERERAGETRHSTARDAAEVARDAGVSRLVLTHISARYSREAPELLAEARAVFPETVVARDGLVVEVPYQQE